MTHIRAVRVQVSGTWNSFRFAVAVAGTKYKSSVRRLERRDIRVRSCEIQDSLLCLRKLGDVLDEIMAVIVYCIRKLQLVRILVECRQPCLR